jgi:hypothetical protein
MQPRKVRFELIALTTITSCLLNPSSVFATAEYDTDAPDSAPTVQIEGAPQIIPRNNAIPAPRNGFVPANTAPINSRETASPGGSNDSLSSTPNAEALDSILPTATSPPSAVGTDQTYSIRLPLGTPGSILPKIHAPAPVSPPSNTFLPTARQSQSVDYKRPVAWRATAEGIRNQPAGSSLVVATLTADFKTIYSAVNQEVQTSGWSIVSDSVSAGHILIKIPKPGDSGDDAAAWLIMTASPIDAGTTEVRIKIQARRASGFAPAVNEFVQRLQLRATGNKLL